MVECSISELPTSNFGSYQKTNSRKKHDNLIKINLGRRYKTYFLSGVISTKRKKKGIN